MQVQMQGFHPHVMDAGLETTCQVLVEVQGRLSGQKTLACAS